MPTPSKKTEVVHCRSIEGFDILIDRTTKFGNPFIIGKDGNRNQVIEKHIKWLDDWIKNNNEVEYEINNKIYNNREVVESLIELSGKRIGFHCYPNSCHGDNFIILLKERFGKI